LTRYWKTSRGEKGAGKKVEREDCGKKEEIRYFLSTDLNKMEAVLEEVAAVSH
jgi:hypothetical protein